MKKQDRNRLSKKDRRLIKKAMLKAAAKGCDEVYRIAPAWKAARLNIRYRYLAPILRVFDEVFG